MTIHFDSEKNLEDMFIDNIEHFSKMLCDDDGYKVIRQPKFGSYGTGDILLYKKYFVAETQPAIEFHLLELKNTKLNHHHISQCARYKSFFHDFFEYCPYVCEINIHLIGLKTLPVSGSDLCYLAQSIDWLEVYELGFSPSKGIVLENTPGWKPGASTDEDYYGFEARYLEG